MMQAKTVSFVLNIFLVVASTVVLGQKKVVPVPKLGDLSLENLEGLLFAKGYKWTSQVEEARIPNNALLDTFKADVLVKLDSDYAQLDRSMDLAEQVFSFWIERLRSRVAIIERHLQLEGQIQQVGFQAFLTRPDYEGVSAISFNNLMPITYGVTTANINEAYDRYTGLMTAPVSGVYLVAARLCLEGNSTGARFDVYHNDQIIAQAESSTRRQTFDAGVAVAMVQMAVGETLSVRAATPGFLRVKSAQTWFMAFRLNHRVERLFFSPR